MSNVDDLLNVVILACVTEDRNDSEQRSLLRMAAKLDNERNAQVVTNKRPRTEPASRLLVYAIETRVLVDDQRPVSLPDKAMESWEKRVERWEGRRRETA